MNTRTTLILAVLALIVGGYLFIAKPWEEKKDETRKPESTAKALFDPKPKDIDKVELVGRGGKDKFTFKKQADNSWQMVQPIQSSANDFEVNSVVDKLGEIKYVKKYDKSDKDRPSEQVSGLDKPNNVVKLYTGDKLQAEATIGSRVPTGSNTYVRKGGDDVIYEANSDLTTSFNKHLDAVRNRNVVKFDLKDVRQVTVEGRQNYKLSHTADVWVVEAPTRGSGDKEAIEKVIRPLSTLYVQDWKDDEPITLRPYQLDKPQLKFTIETTKEIPAKAKPGDANTKPADTQPSTENKNYVLLIGAATEPNATSYFAKLESAPWVFAIPESTFKDLSTQFSELRDKQIVKLANSAPVMKIDSVTPEGPMTLTRSDKGDWSLSGGASADATAVDDLIKTISNLKATDFPAPNSLERFDWAKPRGKITINTRGDPKATTLLVGNNSASGQMVYVKLDSADTVYAIRRTEGDQLLASPVSYQDRSVFKFPRDQANTIEITKAAGDKLTLKKQADKWSIVEPVQAAADGDAVRNLLADVSSLRAKKVVATGDRAKYGLDKPQISLAITTEAPAPRPVTPPAAMTATHPASVSKAPESEQVHKLLSSNAPPSAHPLAASHTPASSPAVDRDRQIKNLEAMLEYNRTHPQEAKAEITEMIQKRLAELQGTPSSQPTIKGAPQGPAESQPASAPSSQPAPVVKVYHLLITQQNGVTYAARDDRETVYELDSKIFDDANAEMHDRQIVKFEVDKVIELGFEHDGNTVALHKSGSDWKYVADPLVPIDNQKVTEVLNVFRDFKTHRYIAYNTADLAKFGLDKDVQKLWVVLDSGDRIEVLLSKTGPAGDTDKSRYAMRVGTKAVFLLKGDQAAKFGQKLEDFLKSANASPPPAPGGAGARPPIPGGAGE